MLTLPVYEWKCKISNLLKLAFYEHYGEVGEMSGGASWMKISWRRAASVHIGDLAKVISRVATNDFSRNLNRMLRSLSP